MTAWNTDIKAAPHGRYVIKQRKEGVDTRIFVPERVILSTKCGKAISSHYVPDEKRWMMLGKGEQPVAWQPWPEPYVVSPSQAAVVTGENLREPMAAASGQIIREGGDAPQEASDGGNLSDTEFAHSLPKPRGNESPEATLLPASGGQFHPGPLLSAGSDGNPSIPSPEAGGAKMDEGSDLHPDRAGASNANSGQAVSHSSVGAI